MTARPAITRTWLQLEIVSWGLTPVSVAYSALADLLRAASCSITSQTSDGAGNQTWEDGAILHRRNPTRPSKIRQKSIATSQAFPAGTGLRLAGIGRLAVPRDRLQRIFGNAGAALVGSQPRLYCALRSFRSAALRSQKIAFV